jgi:hypothetical protein
LFLSILNAEYVSSSPSRIVANRKGSINHPHPRLRRLRSKVIFEYKLVATIITVCGMYIITRAGRTSIFTCHNKVTSLEVYHISRSSIIAILRPQPSLLLLQWQQILGIVLVLGVSSELKAEQSVHRSQTFQRSS